MAADKLDDIESITVSAKALSKTIGVSERMIRYLAQDGIMVKTSSGRYKLQESMFNYIANLRVNQDINRIQNNLEDELNLETEKALNERVKRHMNELKLALMKGNVHKSEDVETVMTDMLANFKTKLIGLPSKLTPQLVKKDKGEIQGILTDEINDVLHELSGYNARDFYGDEYIENYDDEIDDDMEMLLDDDDE